MIDQCFEQHRRPGFVDGRVALDRVHRLTDADLRGEVDNAVDLLQRARDDVFVADVADDQLCLIRKVFGAIAIAVNLLDQAVEHPHVVAAAKKLPRNCAADKTCAAGN